MAASDPNENALEFAVGNAPTGSQFFDYGDGTAEFTWTPTLNQAGQYPNVIFSVTDDGDPVLSDTQAIAISVGNVNQRPTLDPIGSQVVAVGETLEVALTADDPDTGDSLTFSVANAPDGSVLRADAPPSGTVLPPPSNLRVLPSSSAHFTWTPAPGQEGNYTVTFSVTDDGETDGVPNPLTDSEPVSITVGAGNRPPELNPIGSRQVQEEDDVSLVLTASDADGGQLSFSAEGLPAGATLVDTGYGSARFSWIPPTGSRGDYPVTFNVTDDGVPPESDSETVLIEVQPLTNRRPTLSVQGASSVNEGATVSLILNASDPDGDALTITAEGLPEGSSFVDNQNGSARFSWTPALGQQGTYPVTFSVVDSGESPKGDSVPVKLRVFAYGDVDRDGDVDRQDVDRVLDALDRVPGRNDPADVDQDGDISVLDARRAVIQCTRPECASE